MNLIPAPYYIMPVEMWLPITYPKVYPGRYSISNYGRVYNTQYNRFMTLYIGKKGYVKCSLTNYERKDGSFTVHRLVAWEWVLLNRDINLQVNHIDGNKANNFYRNLEWVTPLQNMKHANINGLIINRGGIHSNHKLTEDEVHKICKMLEDPKMRYDDIVRSFNNDRVTKTEVISIANNGRWKNISKNYNIVKRARNGEYSSGHILSENEVHLICSLLQNPRNTYEQIAEAVNNKCAPRTIRKIAGGEEWSHISKDYNIPHREFDYRTGQDHPRSKLTEEDVRNICEMLSDPKVTYNEISKAFDNKITPTNVYRIAKGKLWQDITKDYNIPNRSTSKYNKIDDQT